MTPHDRDQESDNKRTVPHKRYVPYPSRPWDPPNHQDQASKEELQQWEEGEPSGDPQAKAQKEDPARKK